MPVEVVVFAPASEAARFDGWGRPVPAAWERHELAWADFERRVQVCADPAAQAARLAGMAASYAEPEGRLALGIADPEVLPMLEGELARAGLASFNPEGRPMSGEALHHLLAALAELAREPGWEAVATLARCPDFLAYARRCAGGFSAATFLASLDRLRTRHLPGDLTAAIASGGEQPFPENALEVLTEIFAARRLEPGREADARLEAAATAWTEILRLCALAKKRFPRVPDAEWWELALKLFGDERRADEKAAGALELQGWLELLFENAPHLAVAGCNDGLVPEAIAGDAFLPESLRLRLGLKTNAARFARDAYLLQAIVACRPRLDVLLGKTSSAGEPLRPSRLLLRCADAELPARVAFLFRELPPAGPGVPWRRGWRLTPALPKPPTRVAVTALRAWLDCPFRFCLRYVFQMEAVEPGKEELDARDFGTLVHGALESLGKDEALRACADAAVLREFLHRELDRQARERFGAELTLPLLIQFESARQRLAKVAEIEAGERAAGWRTIDVEKKFEREIGGVVVSGKIDRIDRHVETGAVRVLDYKTSDRPVTPAEAHLRPLRRGEQPRGWSVVEIADKPWVWHDLQLPLYELVLAAEFGAGVTCGYFNLPKAVGETSISLWEGLSPEVRGSAKKCAEGVCAAIHAGVFWPPRELAGREAERDDFATLFHQGTAASVIWPEPVRTEPAPTEAAP
jgi:ATP-dependent helicase/nuclease subunit B